VEEKIKSLEEAVDLIQDCSILALGGNLIHRSPAVLAMALGLAGKKGLHLIKTAGAYDVDFLCAMGSVRAVEAGYIGYENEFGLADFYRKGVEEGRIEALEQACYTVIAGLRAAIAGVTFMPVVGLEGSDLVTARGFKKVKDPYGERDFYAIQAITPDWTILHVQKADREGNCVINGPYYEDPIMARAGKKVLVTAEEIVEEDFSDNPALTAIPGFLVDAVVEIPRGAFPGTCAFYYGEDGDFIKKFKACRSSEDIRKLVQEREISV